MADPPRLSFYTIDLEPLTSSTDPLHPDSSKMGLIDSITPGFVARLRATVYTILICFSFFIFIGSAVMKDNYGACPLYSDSLTNPGADANCNYPIAISVIFQFVYLLFRIGLFFLLACGKLEPGSYFFNDVSEMIYVALDLLSFFLTFIAACILSAGRNDACHACNHTGDWHSANDAAQAGAWISTLLWLLVGVCGFLCAVRGGKIPCLGHEGSLDGNNSSGGANRNNASPHNPYQSKPYQDPLGP